MKNFRVQSIKRLLRSFIGIVLILIMVFSAGNTTYAMQYRQSVNEAASSDSDTEIPILSGKAHVQNVGWVSMKNGVLGTEGRGLRLEALQLNVSGVSGLGIIYRAHVQNVGWQSYVSGGVTSGTTGLGRRLEAVQIELTGAKASNYDIYYRAHVQNLGWTAWVKNGATAGSEGRGLRLEAIECKIVSKNAEANDSSASNDKDVSAGNVEKTVTMQAHVQDYGWLPSNGTVIGVTGQSKRIEAIKLTPSGYNMNIEYSVHVQNIGWTGYSKNGEVAGTTGKGLRIEAIMIKLSGTDADNYDIYYRAHVQNIGWMDWAKNGDKAGTSGYGYRLEALDIRIVPKGQAAPGSTTTPYKVYTESLSQAQIYARAKLNQVGWNLRAAFNYAASLTYYRNVPVPASGQHLEGYARYGFENGRGNCYVMAAVFCRMARELGYECYLVEGYVPKIGGGTTVHGWTEIVVNGRTYVCDPDFTHETNHNGYMITYGTSGTWVYQKYSRVN